MSKSVLYIVKSGRALLVAAASMASISFAQGGAWTSKANLPTGRFWLAGSAIEGKVYAIGGTAGGEDAFGLSTTEEYDPDTNSWTRKANMPTGRDRVCACAANGKIYVIGGYADANLRTVEEYDPTTNTWATRADMPTARMGICETVNGKIYVLGGGTVSNTGGTVISVVEEYDPTTNTWAAKANMPRARLGHTSSAVNGLIYIFGGFNPSSSLPGGFVDKVDVYNPATNTWATTSADLPTLRDNLGAASLNGLIYVIGGQSSEGDALSTVEAYDPANNSWTTKTSMPTGRLAFATAAVNGRIYAFGGIGGLRTVEEYDPNPTTAVETGATPAASFVLHQNYRNPFNPETEIRFQLPKAERVVLKIFNTLGAEIRTLVNEKHDAGHHFVRWDGKDKAGIPATSGMYFYQIHAGNFTQVKKMILLR